jgi:hypothetical protein
LHFFYHVIRLRLNSRVFTVIASKQIVVSFRMNDTQRIALANRAKLRRMYQDIPRALLVLCPAGLLPARSAR